MAFQPRVFDTILLDMMAHVRANTTLTDFSVGSVIRTLLEAAALEDDEQYHQMVTLLDDYRYTTATGKGLDERAGDFNVSRLLASAAISKIKYRNDNMTKNILKFNTIVGVTSIEIDDSDEFPVSGYPYTIRIGEGSANVEDVTVTNNDTSTNIFIISATTKVHSTGDRVSEVIGSDININSGVQVQIPSQGTVSPIVFESVDSATLIAGNYESTIVRVKAVVDGKQANAGVGQIKQFTSSPPFSGAGVINTTVATGGRDRETDSELRIRLRDRLSALGKGTRRAIESSVKGTRDPDTGQQIVAANLIENFTTEEHLLYVDDGTGFVPSNVVMARSQINNGGVLPPSSSTVPLTSTEAFPSSGWILISPENPAQAEIIEYTSKTAVQLNLSGRTVNSHDDTDEVLLIDKLTLAEEGQKFFQLANYPIRRNSYNLYCNATGVYRLLVEGLDYFINRTNGQVQIYGVGLAQDTQIIGNYTYMTGLFSRIQKTVNGDKLDTINYPGVGAAGVIIYVDTPIIREVSVTISIAVSSGEDEADIKDNVQTAVETYIEGLLIGQNVILASIIERAMSTVGVINAKIISPDNDMVILENELPRPYDTLGSSLVAVL